jgi:ribosome-binding protein aMBF1 (putative translation factor)
MRVRNLANWYTATDSDTRLERRRFGSAVRKLRQKHNMSRQELAANMNVSIETVDRIERGCVDPNANNLRNKIYRAVTREVMRISV